jgi:hypothetical protein
MVWEKMSGGHGAPYEKGGSWHFTSNGNHKVCEYPKDKFDEIRDLVQTVDQPIGDIIFRIWDGNLRNALPHSG